VNERVIRLSLSLALVTFAAACAGARARPLPAVDLPPAESPLPIKPVEPAAAKPDLRPVELARVTFVAVGDVLPHGAVKKSAERWNRLDAEGRSLNFEGWGELFADVASELSSADLAFANLETPVSASGDHDSRPFFFNAKPAMLQALMHAGIDLVGFANNHVYDQGFRGMIETLDALEALGLPQAGAGRDLASARRGLHLERNGVRIAVLGATQFFNQSQHASPDPKQPQVNKLDVPEAMEEAIRAAREDSDFVILSLHWGVEYEPQPREAEVQLAHRLFEAGADVILGTHPHVLQPIEVYRAADGRTCVVAYSLGNFISNQSRFYAHRVSPEKVGDTRDGAMLRFAIVKRDYGAGVQRTELADVSFVPVWTDNDHLVRKPKDLPDIRVVSLERSIERVRAELEALTASLAARPAKDVERQLVELKRRLEMLARRKEIIETRLGPDFAAQRTEAGRKP
jgi:hypothetical protein